MGLFFQLEGGYIGIAVFALLATVFVTTRPFMGKGLWKKGVPIVGIMLSLLIGAHYMVTKDRMDSVEETFNSGGKVICESKMIRKVAQSVEIEKSKGWELNDHMFSSKNYARDFFSARCIKYAPIAK